MLPGEAVQAAIISHRSQARALESLRPCGPQRNEGFGSASAPKGVLMAKAPSRTSGGRLSLF